MVVKVVKVGITVILISLLNVVLYQDGNLCLISLNNLKFVITSLQDNIWILWEEVNHF